MIGTNPRASLQVAGAEHVLKRPVDQMSGGVVSHDLAAPGRIDDRAQTIADFHPTRANPTHVHDRVLNRTLGILHDGLAARPDNPTCITDLSSRLRVER